MREVCRWLPKMDKADYEQSIQAGGAWSPGQRPFYPSTLFPVVAICVTHFVSGVIIEPQADSLGRGFSTASIVVYRLWIVFERARLQRCAITNVILLRVNLLTCVLTCLVVVYPLILASRVSRLLVSW